MSAPYQSSQIKRVRATKSQVDERRGELYRIVQRMHPMSVRQVYYQATVHGIVEKTENGYNKIQTDRSGERGFVRDLPNFQRLSPKQRNCLSGIAERVLGRGA